MKHRRPSPSVERPLARILEAGARLNRLRDESELHAFLIDEAAALVGARRVMLVLQAGDGRRLAGCRLPPRD